jgi:ribosomal protein L1
LWCCMITRTVRMKCQEAKSEACQQAIADELARLTSRKTWDVDKVIEYKDLMRNVAQLEVMVGRVF